MTSWGAQVHSAQVCWGPREGKGQLWASGTAGGWQQGLLDVLGRNLIYETGRQGQKRIFFFFGQVMLKGRDVKGKEAVKARNSLHQTENALTPKTALSGH